MQGPRKFYIFIIVLLIMNFSFFTIWYAFGGRNLFRNTLASFAGKLIGAVISAGDLHISDKQIYLQDISFAMRDETISVKAESVSIRYSIYKLIFSGFKPDNVITTIEIDKPVVELNIYSGSSEEKEPHRKRFKLPDISPYFKRLNIHNGYVHAEVSVELKIMQEGILHIEESLKNVNISIINEERTSLNLSAISAMDGKLELTGFLTEGNIDIAEAKIENYSPLFAEHPDIENFRTRISGQASFSEKGEEYFYDGDFSITNTSAKLLQQYPVSFPKLSFKADQDDASLIISRANLAGNTLEADLKVQNYMNNMSFAGSKGKLFVDLKTIYPDLDGIVHGEIAASGSIDDPDLTLSVYSQRSAYRDLEFENITAYATFDGETAKLDIEEALWQQQVIDINAMLNIKTKELSANLVTSIAEGNNYELSAQGSLEVEGLLLAPYPLLSAKIEGIDFNFRELNIKGINGTAKLMPTDESLLFEADISAENGVIVSAAGDILDQHIVLDLLLNKLDVSELYALDSIAMFDPLVSGEINCIMMGKSIWFNAGLDTHIRESYPFTGFLSLIGHLNYETLNGKVIANCDDGKLNNQPLPLSLHCDLMSNMLHIRSLTLANIINLSGRLNTYDIEDLDFDLSIRNLDSRSLISYYPDAASMIPDFENLTLFAEYNRRSSQEIMGSIKLRKVDLISIIPLDLELDLDGDINKIQLSGDIKDKNHTLISLKGESSLKPEISLSADAFMNGLKLQDFLKEIPADGTFFGKFSFALENALDKDERKMSFGADIQGQDIKYDEYAVQKIILKGAQEPQALIVDTLFVHADNLLEAWARGSLDYNIIENTFYEGDRNLHLSVDVQLFSFLKELTDYIRESTGSSKLTARIGTQDEQFFVHSGNIDIDDGHILLKDQVEPMRNIEIKGFFDENRVVIQRAQFDMGNGKLYMNNIFDPEPTDHFMLSFLDLGYFRIMIDEPGIQATIPEIAPAKTLTNVSIKGQDSRYATIRGPFDDMSIEAQVRVENLDILFPLGADNLLNLIMSVSKPKKPDSEPLVLPFTMDVYLTIGENVRYATYPTSLYVEPDGFLHLLYDGNRFIVKEANITSERGTVDFFGTVFEVDNIAIAMIDQQDILSVDGSFYKRSPDGSIITLSVHSTPEYDKSFFDRLNINLVSDNPSDQNISQVLSRLRYNQSMDELPEEQKQHLLQDEALGLIGGNLDSTVFSPFIFPIENWFRRTLKLDGFSINAGFITNIFAEYSAGSPDGSKKNDIEHITSDISQFSSSILLNNLSVSMSKYVAYRTFADYTLSLQEATDLQNKTKILVSHDATLRVVLPKKYRLGYTIKYSPKDTGLTHEVMLQKSWRFWGL
ncbi:MAG: hypothetical protein LHW60_07705 [Candidatus Cloacimonetes bacterium]|nr:hypothetical protein [Candidatus Cloacimonadota bacterium]